jgi:hypothetical protein
MKMYQANSSTDINFINCSSSSKISLFQENTLKKDSFSNITKNSIMIYIDDTIYNLENNIEQNH